MRLYLSALFVAALVGCVAPSSSVVSPVAPSGVPVVGSVALSEPRLLAPDAVLADQFTGQLDRAVRKAFRQTGNGLVPKTLTNLVTVGINTRPAGTYTVPVAGGNQVAVDAGLMRTPPNVQGFVRFCHRVSADGRLATVSGPRVRTVRGVMNTSSSVF